MLTSKGGRKPLLILFVLAALAGALIGPTSAAAGNSVFARFSFELFGDYVEGWGPPNTNLKITLRGAEGDYQGHFWDETDNEGFFEGDLWGDIQPGDRLIATDGSTSRTYIVQPLSFRINRATDVVSGKTVPNSSVELGIFGCQTEWDDCDFEVEVDRSTNGQGNFSYDSTNQYNIRGNDFVRVEWSSPQGDSQRRYLDAPSVNAWVGNNEAWGDARPRQDVSVWLFNSQGTQKARFKDRANPWNGFYDGLFQANGRAVNIRAGDFIGSNIASDALWRTVANNPTFNLGTDVVTGKCFKNKIFEVFVSRQEYGSASVDGTANSNGNFSVNLMEAEGWDLQSGDVVEIGCRNALGDEQFTDFEVPEV